jgi:hypothetical protein
MHNSPRYHQRTTPKKVRSSRSRHSAGDIALDTTLATVFSAACAGVSVLGVSLTNFALSMPTPSYEPLAMAGGAIVLTGAVGAVGTLVKVAQKYQKSAVGLIMGVTCAAGTYVGGASMGWKMAAPVVDDLVKGSQRGHVVSQAVRSSAADFPDTSYIAPRQSLS